MAKTIHTNQFLTNFATSYKSSMDIGEFVAPGFKVKRPSDKYRTFGKDWMRVYDAKVSGRMEGQEITYNAGSANYSCEEYELADFVLASERRNQDNIFNIDQESAMYLKNAMVIARNKRVIDIAFNASLVTQTAVPSNKWDNVTSGTPIEDMKTAIAAINTGSSGQTPNKIIMSLNTALGISKTDNFKEYFKYTSSDKLFNIMSALRNLGLEPMIYNDFGVNTNEGGASDPGVESMMGDKCLLFYDQGAPTTRSQTFMYSPYTFRNKVETEKQRKGDKHFMSEEIDELAVDLTCGYLYTNCLASE